MSAASQDHGLAGEQSPGAVAAPVSDSTDHNKPSLADRIIGLVGEWPDQAGDSRDAHQDTEALEPSEWILADRLATSLTHHEPGWRLPRPSVLASRYGVHIQQVDRAIDELIRRQIVRRVPNGQLYRTSPAEYLLMLEGVPGLCSRLDPMGQHVTGRRQVSRRPCPEDAAHALGIPAGQLVSVTRVSWTVGTDPAGVTTTYLRDEIFDFAQASGWQETLDSAVAPLMRASDHPAADRGTSVALRPGGLFIEMQPPPPSVAKALRLTPGQAAALVIVRFDDPVSDQPAALTVAALRADKFRIVIESPGMAFAEPFG